MKGKTLRITAFSAMGGISVLLVAAAFVDKLCGTAAAIKYVYAAPWTIVVWVVAVVFGVSYIVHERKTGQISIWVFLLHLAFPVILAGAMITHIFSREGLLHLRVGEQSEVFINSSGEEEQMPFAVMLEDFNVVCYSGTSTPEDYVSEIVLLNTGSEEEDKGSLAKSILSAFVKGATGRFSDKGAGSGAGLPSFTPSDMPRYDVTEAVASGTVAMNRIFRYRGWRICQSVYDDDELGAVFAVSFDPVGISVTYLGYIVFVVAAFLYLLFGHRHRRHSEEARNRHHRHHTHDYIGTKVQRMHSDASSRALSLILIPFLLLLCAVPLSSANHHPALHAPVADSFCNLLVEYNGSVCTMSTLAEDVSGKLYGGNGYKAIDGSGFSERRSHAEQVFYRISYTKPLAFVLLLLGMFFMAAYCFLRAKGKHLPRWFGYVMAAFLVVCSLFLLAMLCLRWYISGHVPLSNGHETMQSLAWLSMVAALLWSFRSRSVLPYGYLVSAFALLVSAMSASDPQITYLMPVLRSPLLSLHVGVIMLAYALFAFVMLNGVAALFMTDNEQHRMRHMSEKLLRPAVCLLAAGIFLGAVWANISWGRYWGWDPKEVWALITLLVYAAPLHKRSLSAFQNVRFFHIYTIIAFLSVLITYFGVNFFLGGIHSYA